MVGDDGSRPLKVVMETRRGASSNILEMTPLSLPEQLLTGEADPPHEPLSPRATTFEPSGAHNS